MDIKEEVADALKWADLPLSAKVLVATGLIHNHNMLEVLAAEVRRLTGEVERLQGSRNVWHTRAEVHRVAKEAAEAKLAKAEEVIRAGNCHCTTNYECQRCKALRAYEEVV